MEVEVSAHGPNLAAVIQQEEIPLCRSIKLPDLNISKPADEFLPDLRPHPVSKRQSHSVASIVELLSGRELKHFSRIFKICLGAAARRTYLRRIAKVAHDFTDVLEDGDVIFPAVGPELRG